MCRSGGHGGANASIEVTPLLGILVAVVSGLSLVAVAIIVVIRLRPARSSGSGSSGGPATRRNNGHHYMAPATTADPGVRAEIDEKNPDVIPSNKGEFSTYTKIRGL